MPLEPPSLIQVNQALRLWRQGDCVLGPEWFVFRCDPKMAITEEGRAAAASGSELAEEDVAGLVVLTQTCDVVRDCEERPFVEVSPLIKVAEDILHEIERGRRPRFAFVPALAGRCLVADLDRVMTLEKPALAAWVRTPGWTTDAEGRAFTEALVRKRSRFAFPDDFCLLVRELEGRLRGKHDKDSDEGRALRALGEIRVSASPAWTTEHIDLFFFFVRENDSPDFGERAWSGFLHKWLALMIPAGRFATVEGIVAMLADLTAEEYVASDRLDFGHLSQGE